MAEFIAVTASNGPKVKDHEAVERVIAGFFFDPELKIGVAFDPDDGSPSLFIYGYRWPEAWEVPIGIPRDEFDPYSDDTYEEGADGFIALLQELALYLEEPLIVQAIGNEKCRYPLSACEWRVAPGGTEVVVSEFGHDLSTAETTNATI
jgi:hypothetical protein